MEKFPIGTEQTKERFFWQKNRRRKQHILIQVPRNHAKMIGKEQPAEKIREIGVL